MPGESGNFAARTDLCARQIGNGQAFQRQRTVIQGGNYLSLANTFALISCAAERQLQRPVQRRQRRQGLGVVDILQRIDKAIAARRDLPAASFDAIVAP